MRYLLISFLVLATLVRRSSAAERAVIIVAGQSNALNWHAAGDQLPPDPRDADILFYFETGAPPERGAAVPFNATSNGKWVTLALQRQEPFVRYEREFFGPEMSLARRVARVSGIRELAVIKVAYFGTNLAADWNPAATTGNQLYARLRMHVDAALRLLRDRSETPRIVGFFWMQGETDGTNSTHAAAYADHLRSFIARVRRDHDTPALPFVLGRIGPQPAKGYVHQNAVRIAQVQVAERVPAMAWVDTDDLVRDTDGIHLLAPGVIALGERMANAWQTLDRRAAASARSTAPNP